MARQATIFEIGCAAAAEEVETFASMPVYVVNHYAIVPFPRKFVYNACPRCVAGGRVCGNSVINGVSDCEHNAPEDSCVDTYRFELFLLDAKAPGKPLQVTCFDAATIFLGYTAETFKTFSHEKQANLVSTIIRGMPLVDVTLRVRKGCTTVQKLSMRGGPTTALANESPTRRHLPANYNASPSRALSFGASSFGLPLDRQKVKAKVAELVDLIAESLTL